MDTKALRQKILDLAIHGKLVAQDPDDKPASELLKCIKAEKELSNYGQLPKNWCWLQGENIFLPMKSVQPRGEKFLYVDIDAIDNKHQVVKEIKTIETIKAPSRARRYTQQGDVLFSMVRPYLRNIAKIDIDDCIASTGFYVCSPIKEILLSEYCYFLMISDYVVDGLNQFMKGDNSPSINKKDIDTWYFPLPPLAEQKRIVAEIERWFALIDQIEQGKSDLQAAIEQTKKKILDLAIHGKLVAQNPDDEPASELLKRIKAEKERKIKEGKIKKSKKTKTISDTPKNENVPFEIPSSWEWTTLGEVGVWQAGGTPNRTNKAYYGGTIPWLKTGDLNDGLITDIPEFITEEAVANSSAKLNPAGSVLIAMYGATIGKLGILSYPATTNQACCACIEYSAVEQLFLFYFLLFQRTAFIEKGGGGAQPNISKEIIVNTCFPLPPLAEQKRIVKKIEELFGVLDTIQQALE